MVCSGPSDKKDFKIYIQRVVDEVKCKDAGGI